MSISPDLTSGSAQFNSEQQASDLSDSEREAQLEIEIQAFAELLLDIYEWRRKQKRAETNSQSQLDPIEPGHKMGLKVEKINNSLKE